MTPFRLEDKYKHFEGTCCHHLQGKNEPNKEKCTQYAEWGVETRDIQ